MRPGHHATTPSQRIRSKLLLFSILVTVPALAAEPRPPAGPRAIVVSGGHATREPSRVLGRSVYGQTRWRAAIDEPNAQVLVAREPANKTPVLGTQELGALVRAAMQSEHPSVERLLWTLVGRAFDTSFVLVVRAASGGVSAKVFRVEEGDFVAERLTARADGSTVAWPDAAPMLRSMFTATQSEHAHAGKRPVIGKDTAKSAAEPMHDRDLLRSPWFWAGLGVVAAVGTTVFVISQASGHDPDTVLLQGAVSP